MKKIVCTAVSALALAAFADGVNSTEFGVLTVPSTAKETIVSVPWLESGTGSAEVKVCDLVLTAGLKASTESSQTGDELRYWNGSDWTTWLLTEDETTHVKSWQKKTGGTSPEDLGLARGRAILLIRPDSTAREDKFYVMGKPTTEGATVNLTGSKGVYTLVAPPTESGDTDVNSGMTWTGIVAGDKLLIPSSTGDAVTSLSWKSGTGWRMWDDEQEKWISTGIKIKVGLGAWFVNSDTSTKSFTFGKVSK